jgi:hypothetical protein
MFWVTSSRPAPSNSQAYGADTAVRSRMAMRVAALGLCMCAASAHAADGCVVLLCLAAPSWRAIPACVPPVREALRDVARGRPFPSCSMSGRGNQAQNQWSSAPTFCPPQYTRVVWETQGPYYTCDYGAAIVVEINGIVWSRVWWNLDGSDIVTEYSPAAKAQMQGWDTRFDDDYAAWQATQVPPCASC